MSEYPIDDCFALHVYNDMPAGKINLVSGPRMAGAVCFGVHVIGKSGHGSRPDLAKNPVIPASHIVCELDSVFTKSDECRGNTYLQYLRTEGW